MKLQKNTSRDSAVFIIGGTLILLVMLITFWRGMDFSKDQENEYIVSENTPDTVYSYIQANILYKNKLEGESYSIVDVRDAEDYEFNHIMDSENIPLAALPQYVHVLNKSSKIVIVGYENNEQIAKKAVDILTKNGVQELYILSGGFASWVQKNFQSVSWGDPRQFIDQSKVTYITPQEVKSLTTSKTPPFLLDVRESSLYATSHIQNSVNIPLVHIEEKRSELPHTQEIIVYGATALESFRGGSKLFDLSVYNVKTLQGSYQELIE